MWTQTPTDIPHTHQHTPAWRAKSVQGWTNKSHPHTCPHPLYATMQMQRWQTHRCKDHIPDCMHMDDRHPHPSIHTHTTSADMNPLSGMCAYSPPYALHIHGCQLSPWAPCMSAYKWHLHVLHEWSPDTRFMTWTPCMHPLVCCSAACKGNPC